jgi:VWFA-related protein
MFRKRKCKALEIMMTLFLVLFLSINLRAQEPLEYEVSVEAMLVPLFAVDASGSPVYDLKQEELELFVNNKPIEITHFQRYEFEYDKEITREITIKDKKEPAFRPPDRAIFIIIDGVFNTSEGLRRTKKIASKLIKGASEGDRFIIIENTFSGGLKHIAGPGGNRDLWLKNIKKIAPLPPPIWMRKLYQTNDLTNIEGGSEYRMLTGSRKSIEKIEYKNIVRRSSHILSQFKYALKTITEPKIVFLISEGVAKGAFEESVDPVDPKRGLFVKTYLFNYLNEIVKAVNQGGSVLYTINPQNIEKSIDQGASGEMSLRYLASESGGEYFAGSDTDKIIKRIKKTTAAYYELAFHIPAQLGDNLELTIKCKRKDVRVHTLSHSERNRPYHKMEPVQKKIFALNVVTGGSWSRMVAMVTKAKIKKIKKEKGLYNVNVELPAEMKNRNLDVCLLYLGPTTEAVDMDFETIKVKESLDLKIPRMKNKRQFFVIIDPTIPYCIYNRIK